MFCLCARQSWFIPVACVLDSLRNPDFAAPDNYFTFIGGTHTHVTPYRKPHNKWGAHVAGGPRTPSMPCRRRRRERERERNLAPNRRAPCANNRTAVHPMFRGQPRSMPASGRMTVTQDGPVLLGQCRRVSRDCQPGVICPMQKLSLALLELTRSQLPPSPRPS